MRGIINHFRSRRARLERDLDRELRYHIERRVEELVADGVSEPEARRRASLEIGGVARVREAVRETWTWPTLDALALDFRYALRSLIKSKGFALGTGAVLTLALAANMAVFSVVNAVLLEPLPYPDADRLVSIETLWTNTGRVSQDVSGADYLDWEAQSDVFESMTTIYGFEDEPTIVGDRAVFANQYYVSEGFFTVFGQAAARDPHTHHRHLGRRGTGATRALPGSDGSAARRRLNGSKQELLRTRVASNVDGGRLGGAPPARP